MVDENREKDKFYFQFPVMALQFGKPLEEVTRDEVEERVSLIIRWCVWNVASQFTNEQANELSRKVDELRATVAPRFTEWEINTDEDYEGWLSDAKCVLAADRLGIIIHETYAQPYYSVKLPVNQSKGKTFVRISRSIMFEARDSWDWKRFAFLGAVYAGIGNDRCKCLTFDRISALACGFSSGNEIGNEKVYLPTLPQTRYAVQKLEKHGWFARASPDNRHMYYTNKMTAEQLVLELREQLKKHRSINHKKRTEEIRKGLGQ